MATGEKQEGESGGTVRSPGYPSLSLREAVTKTKAVYDKDKTAGTPMAAVWPLLGYTGKSGPAATTLASLKRFGLLEVKSGRVFPTQRSVAILCLPESDPRRQQALQEAVTSPQLYKGLLDQYKSSGLPSAESLEHELLLGGRFNHNSVRGLVRDFFASLRYAGLTDDAGVLLHSESPSDDDGDEPDDPDEEEKAEEKAPKNATKRKRAMATVETKQDVYTLPEGDITLEWPVDISTRSIEEVEDWLALMVRKLKRSAKTGPPADSEA